MTATRIDGKAIAAELRGKIKDAVATLPFRPGLAVVLVGNNPASEVYVRNKGKMTREVGMESFEFHLPADITNEALLAQIAALNNDSGVHGILVQLPLPAHLDEATVIEHIKPEKDVDGFHAVNAGKLATGQRNTMVPCTPLGCLILLKRTLGNDLTGKIAVVLGRSNIVGKPMAALLLQESCTVTIAHSKTENLKALCHTADILVTAVGRPEMVKGSWVKPGAVVIDVGINRIETGLDKTTLVGDVAFDEVVGHAGAITPVPGGVGPMTIACLLYNTLKAACAQKKMAFPLEDVV